MNRFLIGGAACLLFAAAESCGSPVAAESPGPPGVSGYEVVTDRLFIPIGITASLSLTCPLTKVALSSGWAFHGSSINVLSNFPGLTGEIPSTADRKQWTFKMQNTGNVGEFVDLYVICVLAG